VASKLLAPKRPNSAKDAPYECGIVPSRESPERFPVSFYIVAMLLCLVDLRSGRRATRLDSLRHDGRNLNQRITRFVKERNKVE
ncbi:MAG: NADH-quinone oxidoreductase subunit A, partial [Actinobacteria bacterium]|nr:NADH-quinone oxidoreductase subunit A [Actinomycetota bacterium]